MMKLRGTSWNRFLFALVAFAFMAFLLWKNGGSAPLARREKRGGPSPSPTQWAESDRAACEAWTFPHAPARPPYFLTSVILLRIHKRSKAKLTSRELRQWLVYQRYMGIEHVYLYDAYLHANESQRANVSKFIDNGFVTYVDWHEHNPYTIQGTQVAAYQHCIDHSKTETEWQVAIDIDEYPFSPVDRDPGFLSRYVRKFDVEHEQVSEICMQNYLFLGWPLWERELLIDRLWRRTPKRSNRLVKPIYRTANVQAQVHHNYALTGKSMDAPDAELRLNHYWGARLQNWGKDTPEVLNMTIVDKGMEYIVEKFKKCAKWTQYYMS